MAGEIALGPLRNTAAAPCYQDVLGQPRVGILDLDKGKLDAALIEVLDELLELSFCVAVPEGAAVSSVLRERIIPKMCHHLGVGRLGHSPPVLSTLSTLSLEPLSWKAFTSGACTEKSAHWACVGELEDGAGPLTTPL